MHRARFASALLIAAIVTVVATAVAGCGDSNGNEASKESEPATESHAGEAPARSVPASLGEAESGAEDIIDLARQGKRAKVVATAHALRRTTDGPVAADLHKAGVPEERIDALQDRARELESLAPRAAAARISLAANQISALMPELYARYRDPVPPDVLKLDYLDREVQLRSLAGERASLSAAVKELGSTWARLRPRVVDVGGNQIAARYTHHVASMRRLASGSDERRLQSEAATGLELVDELERQFRTG